jgi:hypothetical protein
MKPNHFHEMLIAIAMVLGLSLAAAEFYSVRELLASLIIFSVLFGTMGTAVLLLILIQEAVLKGAAHVKALAERHGDPVLRNRRWN